MARPLLIFLLTFFCAKLSASGQSPNANEERLQRSVAAGSAALQAGDYSAAEHAFRDALTLEPASVPLLNNLAISVARQQREAEAIELYRKALRLKPGDSITERNLGVAYFRNKQYQLALPLLERTAQESNSFQATSLAGLDLFALDRYKQAADYLEKAHQLDPSDIETLDMLGKAYMRSGNYAAVTTVFSEMMATNPNSAEAHAMMAMADDKLFREDEAIKEFKAAEAADPHYPGIHTGLGVIYWRNGNVNDAEIEFREELKSYPKDPVANCTLGRILRRRNNPAEAVVYLEAALAENPSYRDALIELAECQISLGQPALAVEPLKKAIGLQPNDPEPHYILGTALSKSGRGKDGSRERLLAAKLQSENRARESAKSQ